MVRGGRWVPEPRQELVEVRELGAVHEVHDAVELRHVVLDGSPRQQEHEPRVQIADALPVCISSLELLAGTDSLSESVYKYLIKAWFPRTHSIATT